MTTKKDDSLDGTLWEDLSVEEKLEALGFEGKKTDEVLSEALDAFMETVSVIEDVEALAKSAQADLAEAKSVIDQIVKLVGEAA